MDDEELRRVLGIIVPELLAIVRGLLKMAVTAQVELDALVRILQDRGQLPSELWEAVREVTRQEIEPVLQGADRTSSAALLELLRKFEGPKQ